MLNILLNKTDFDQRWAAASIMDVLYDGVKVLIMPFAHNEGWAMDSATYDEAFMSESDYREDLKRPFIAYGVDENDIHFLNTFAEDHESSKRKIENSDVVFLVGSDVDDVMDGIEDLDLVQVFKQYTGTVIGASAGALVQMDEFRSEREDGGYRKGLGIVSGIDLDIHYEENEEHLKHIIDVLETRRDQILVLPYKGGIVVSGISVDFMGSAFLFDMTHLDELYRAYQTYLV